MKTGRRVYFEGTVGVEAVDERGVPVAVVKYDGKDY